MTTLKETRPPTLTGKIASRAGEIEEARARGVTWRLIAATLCEEVGLNPEDPDAATKVRQAFHSARRQIEKGRLRPGRPDQKVPEPPAVPAAPADRMAAPTQPADLPPVPGTMQEKSEPPARKGFKRIKLDPPINH